MPQNEYVIKDRTNYNLYTLEVDNDQVIGNLADGYPEQNEPILQDLFNPSVFYKIYSDDSVIKSEVTTTEQNDFIILYDSTSDKNYMLIVYDGTISILQGNEFIGPTRYLTTVSNVKNNFNIDPDETKFNNIIADLIKQKTSDIESYCGRVFNVMTYSGEDENTLYNGDGSDRLLLRQYPIISITSIHDDIDRQYNASDLLSSDDYYGENDSGMIVLDGEVFTKGKRNIKVLYQAGYKTIPEDLRGACEKLVYADLIENTAGVNTAVSDEVIYKPSKLRSAAFRIIDRYKRLDA